MTHNISAIKEEPLQNYPNVTAIHCDKPREEIFPECFQPRTKFPSTQRVSHKVPCLRDRRPKVFRQKVAINVINSTDLHNQTQNCLNAGLFLPGSMLLSPRKITSNVVCSWFPFMKISICPTCAQAFTSTRPLLFASS